MVIAHILRSDTANLRAQQVAEATNRTKARLATRDPLPLVGIRS